MRLGLVGRGPQAERYKLLRNGGQSIVSQVAGHVGAGEYRAWLDTVDAVIIATHPAGHRDLVLGALESGTPVLCEKPLALTLADCEAIFEASERSQSNRRFGGAIPLEVAHTRLWSRHWRPRPTDDAVALVTYQKHVRSDYSLWLDWAPHAIAMLAEAMPSATAQRLYRSVSITEGECKGVHLVADDWSYYDDGPVPPMFLMVRDFIAKLNMSLTEQPKHWKERNAFNRRVYRALFAQENHGTT